MRVPQTVADYVELLESGQPFTHSNIGGDGEFLTIVGWLGTNSDGRASTREKGNALARVILEPRLDLHGYNPGKPGSPKLHAAERWLREHGVNVPTRGHSAIEDPDYGRRSVNVRWVHKEIISSANVRGQLGRFLAALRERPVVVVGSEAVTEKFARGVLAARGHVSVPLSVGWEERNAIGQEVRRALSGAPDGTVVTWGLGYLSKVLTWQLAPEYPGVTQLDVGAMWDAYCGVRSRHGYRLPDWPAMAEQNLREAGAPVGVFR